MAVAFDAVGPSSTGQVQATVAAFTWTHTPVGTPTEIVVFLVAGLTGGGAGGAVGSFASVSYGGNAMTLDSSVAGGASTFGAVFCYKLNAPPAGAQTVSVGAYTVPTGATFSQTIGISVSVTGGGSFAAHPTPVSGNAATGSLSFLSTTTGGLCIAGACDGSGVESVTAGTQRFLSDQNSSSMGNTVGATLASTGGTATISFAWTLDLFGIVGVEVLPAGGAPPVPLPGVQPLPPAWFPGSDAVVTRPGTSPFLVPPARTDVFIQPPPVLPDTGYAPPQPPGWFPGADLAATQPGGIPFYIQPLPVAEPGAVIIPPLPPPPPTPLPPIGPYWFPGADVLASCPGDIPFWIQPQPDSSPQLPPGPGLPVITGLSGGTSSAWFKDQFGNPRWMFSDTVWTIVYSAGRSGAQSWQKDMDQVVSTRASQGYTALECNLLPNNEYITSGLTTWDGIHPFVTGVDPSSGLNDTYWQRVDYLLTSLAVHGMTLFMNLLMGEDLAAGVAGSWTAAQQTAYGNAVATRYLSVKNIVWMINDDGGVDATTMTNILTGIRNAGDTRFIACENPQETTSRFGFKLNDVQTFGTASAQYNWVYTYAPTYGGIEYAYGEANPLPVIRGDGYYYNSDGNPSDKISRETFWWCITSGSRGYSWGMSDGGWGAFAAGWTNNLTMGADEIGTAGDFQNNVFPAVTNYLTNLANWQKLAPDINNVFITAGRGTRAPYQTEGIQNQYTGTPPDTYVSGSVATDGTLALIYFSRGAVTTITVNQALLGTGYTATWVDPANVATSVGTPGPTFTKPAGANSAGDHDWLLVLQGPAVVPLAAPGLPAAVPPGWFPGADLAATQPGGIPFAQPYVPDPGAAAVTTITDTVEATAAGAVTAVVTQIAPATAAGAGTVTDVVTQIAPATAAGAGATAALAVEQAPATAAGAAAVTDVVTQIVIGAAAGAAAVADVVTLQALATAAGAGAVTDVVTQIAPATAAGAGAATAVVTQDAGLLTSAAGAGSVTDVVTQIVIATAAGAGSATATGTVAGVLTDPAPQWQPQSPGWFPGAQAVTVDPGGIPFWAQPQPAVTAPAPSVITGTAAAAGAGSVTAVVTQDAGTSTTAAGAGAVSDVVTQAATATAAGAGSVNALAVQQAPGTAAGAASVSDVVTQIAFASAAGAGSVTAVGTSSGAATASAAGAGAVTALATQIAPATAAGAGSVAAVVTEQAPGTAAAAAAVNAAGAIAGAASIAGAGAATAKVTQGVIGTAAGTGALSALSALQATAALAAAGAVNANGASVATVVKGYSGGTTVTEQAGMAAAVSEQAGMSAAVGERASSSSSVS